jgi:1,4-alpha-glucan branching enzyme
VAHAGFEWVDCHDAESSVLSFLRKGGKAVAPVLGVFNFTPIPRRGYRVGAPFPGVWTELLDTDAARFGGSGMPTPARVEAIPAPLHGRSWSLVLDLPPLSAVFLKPESLPADAGTADDETPPSAPPPSGGEEDPPPAEPAPR